MLRKTFKTSGILICFFLLISTQVRLTAEESLHRVWTVKDCRILTLASPLIEKGTVVIRNGLIEAAGTNVSIPADAESLIRNCFSVAPACGYGFASMTPSNHREEA